MPRRPREFKNITDIRSAARGYTRTALECLSGIVNCEKAPKASRVAAAVALLDRGWGRAPQDIHVKGKIETHIIQLIQGLDAIPAPVVIEQVQSDDEDEQTQH